jgi:hypothetical protein
MTGMSSASKPKHDILLMYSFLQPLSLYLQLLLILVQKEIRIGSIVALSTDFPILIKIGSTEK